MVPHEEGGVTRQRHPSLAVGDPHLAAEWASQNALAPEDVTCGMARRVWWRCSTCQHEWQATVVQRATGAKTGCPACRGRVPTPAQNLQVEHPAVAAEWHPERNGELTPATVVSGSGRRAWWVCCRCSHEWQVSIAQRTTPGAYRSPRSNGCPRCSGRVATRDRNFAVLHPQAAAEWHPTRNDRTADQCPPSSTYMAWWLCSACGHEWQATLYNRAKGSGCHACAGHVVTEANSLAAVRPDIARLWHPTRNGVPPTSVTPSASKHAWWLCDVCEHEWRSQISWRTARSTGCPACAGQAVTATNSLAAQEPYIAAEWHPERNGSLRPTDVTTGASVKVWWLCDRGHEWQATVAARARNRRNGCPRCVFAQSSRIERAVFKAVREVYPSAVTNVRWPRPDAPKRHVRPDIVIPELSLVVEYDGAYWHAGREQADRERNALMGGFGYEVVRVREQPLEALGPHDIVVPAGASAESILPVLVSAIRSARRAVS